MEVSVLDNIFASITAARSLDVDNSEQVAMVELGKVASFLRELAEREQIEKNRETIEAQTLLIMP